MGKFGGELVVLLAGVIGLAMVAVLVSKNAQTPQVLGAAGKAFGGLITAATGPVTGSTGFSTPAIQNFN